MISFEGGYFTREMILQRLRWYLAYALSYRDIEELFEERGPYVDHSTFNRWVVHYAPLLEKVFRNKKRRVGKRWRMEEECMDARGRVKLPRPRLPFPTQFYLLRSLRAPALS